LLDAVLCTSENNCYSTSRTYSSVPKFVFNNKIINRDGLFLYYDNGSGYLTKTWVYSSTTQCKNINKVIYSNIVLESYSFYENNPSHIKADTQYGTGWISSNINIRPSFVKCTSSGCSSSYSWYDCSYANVSSTGYQHHFCTREDSTIKAFSNNDCINSF